MRACLLLLPGQDDSSIRRSSGSSLLSHPFPSLKPARSARAAGATAGPEPGRDARRTEGRVARGTGERSRNPGRARSRRLLVRGDRWAPGRQHPSRHGRVQAAKERRHRARRGAARRLSDHGRRRGGTVCREHPVRLDGTVEAAGAWLSIDRRNARRAVPYDTRVPPQAEPVGNLCRRHHDTGSKRRAAGLARACGASSERGHTDRNEWPRHSCRPAGARQVRCRRSGQQSFELVDSDGCLGRDHLLRAGHDRAASTTLSPLASGRSTACK